MKFNYEIIELKLAPVGYKEFTLSLLQNMFCDQCNVRRRKSTIFEHNKHYLRL